MPEFDTYKRWVVADWRAHSDWRAQAREDFRFVAGDQWTDEEKQMLEDQARVPVVFNRTATIINSVAGSEVNNRTEVRYYPRSLGDAEMNETLTKGGEWYRDQAGAEEEESQGFYDTLISGLGWTESILSFEEDSEGQPEMQRINPLEMCWDGSAERRGLVDARRIARVREVALDDARDMFPDVSDEDLSARWMDKEKDPSTDEATRQWSDDDYNHADDDEALTDEKPTTVTIIQLQYKVRVREIEYRDPMTGKTGKMSRKQFGRVEDMVKSMGHDVQIESREVSRWEWKQAVLGNIILEENQPCADAPTFVPITGYWDNEKRQWFGLVRQMKDPQKFANKYFSMIMHIIAANSKGGTFIEEDAVDDHADFEENYAAADAAIWVRSGALGQGKISPKPQVNVPPSLIQMMEYAITSIRDTSGVNQELLGMRDQNQPGVLEYQRKQAAMTTIASLFDALRLYRKQQGKVLLYFIREFLADGRLVRIADENGERYERLVLTDDHEKFDIIVDDAPTSPNNKERVWEIIMQLMPVLTQAGLPKEIWAEIIKYSPFPEALIQKLTEYAQKPDEQDPAQQAAQKLAIEQMQADLAKTHAEIEERGAEAEKERANAFENMAQGQLALIKAQQAPVATMVEAEKDSAQADLARAKLGGEGQKATMDFLAKMAQIQAQQQKPQTS